MMYRDVLVPMLQFLLESRMSNFSREQGHASIEKLAAWIENLSGTRALLCGQCVWLLFACVLQLCIIFLFASESFTTDAYVMHGAWMEEYLIVLHAPNIIKVGRSVVHVAAEVLAHIFTNLYVSRQFIAVWKDMKLFVKVLSRFSTRRCRTFILQGVLCWKLLCVRVMHAPEHLVLSWAFSVSNGLAFSIPALVEYFAAIVQCSWCRCREARKQRTSSMTCRRSLLKHRRLKPTRHPGVQPSWKASHVFARVRQKKCMQHFSRLRWCISMAMASPWIVLTCLVLLTLMPLFVVCIACDRILTFAMCMCTSEEYRKGSAVIVQGYIDFGRFAWLTMFAWAWSWVMTILILMVASVLSTIWFGLLLLELVFCITIGPRWPEKICCGATLLLKIHWLLQASRGDALACWACVLITLRIHCQNFWCCEILTMAVTLLITPEYTMLWLLITAIAPIFPPKSEEVAPDGTDISCSVQHLSMYAIEAAEMNMRGVIDGVAHTGAFTRGDGACALHACFGIPEAGGLHKADVRACVLRKLPVEYSSAVARLPASMQHSLESEVLDQSVWRVARDGALCILRNQDFQVSEQKVIWDAIVANPLVDVEGLLSFVQAQVYEIEHADVVMQELAEFYQDFFRPEHEDVIRSLCILLNYLEENGMQDFHFTRSLSPGDRDRYEGSLLELLHACTERPELTKFGALFMPDPRLDRYRKAFFDPTGAGIGYRFQLLSNLDILAEEYADRREVAALLRRGRDLLQKRFQLYGNMATPATWSNDLAWSIFRAALGDNAYWLTYMDLKVVLAFFDCSIEVFDAMAESPQVYTFDRALSSTREVPHARQHVRVALERSEPGSERGHFSRLFSDEEWQLHEAEHRRGSGSEQDGETSTASHSDDAASVHDGSSEVLDPLGDVPQNSQTSVENIAWAAQLDDSPEANTEKRLRLTSMTLLMTCVIPPTHRVRNLSRLRVAMKIAHQRARRLMPPHVMLRKR